MTESYGKGTFVDTVKVRRLKWRGYPTYSRESLKVGNIFLLWSDSDVVMKERHGDMQSIAELEAKKGIMNKECGPPLEDKKMQRNGISPKVSRKECSPTETVVLAQ